MTHYMIDLETLDTRVTASVSEIAIVRFDPHGSEVEKIYHGHISKEDQRSLGRTISQSTMQFRLEHGYDPEITGEGVRATFAEIIRKLNMYSDKEDRVFWCKGGGFDFPILKSLLHAIGKDPFWHYGNEHCVRALFKGFRHTGIETPNNNPHNALSDCLAQIEHLKKVLDGGNLRYE